MKRTTALIPLTLLIAAAAAGAAAGPDRRNDGTARAKARHFLMQTSPYAGDGDAAERYELARRALTADPGYPEAAWQTAVGRLAMRLDTMRSDAEMSRTLGMARMYVDTYPGDYDESMLYAYWNNSLMVENEGIRVLERLDTLYPERTDILLQLADAYLRHGRNAESVATLNRYERIEGSSPQLALRKISIYLHDKDTVSALREADTLVIRNPRQGAMRLIRGNVYGYVGRDSLALADYLEAERMDPSSSGPKLALADYYMDHDDPDGYDRKTYEAVLSEDLEPEERVEMAGNYLGRILSDSVDNTARAEKLLATLRDRYPHEPEVLKLNAEYLFSESRYDEAIETMGYATELSPDNSEIWGALLMMCGYSSRFDRLKDYYTRSLAYVSPSQDSRMLYALACANTGESDKAIDVYTALLDDLLPGVDAEAPFTDTRLAGMLPTETAGRIGNLFTFIGDARHAAGQNAEAWQAYENALVFNPNDAMTMNNYAYFLALEGADLEKAATLSHRSLQINSTSPTFMDTYAWILYLQGDYEGAYRYESDAISAARDQDSLSAEYFDHMGDICYRLGKRQEAVENWKEARNLAPEDKEIQNKIRTGALPK